MVRLLTARSLALRFIDPSRQQIPGSDAAIGQKGEQLVVDSLGPSTSPRATARERHFSSRAVSMSVAIPADGGSCGLGSDGCGAGRWTR